MRSELIYYSIAILILLIILLVLVIVGVSTGKIVLTAIIGFIIITFMTIVVIVDRHNVFIHYDGPLPRVDILPGPIDYSMAAIDKRKQELERNSKSINTKVDKIYKEFTSHITRQYGNKYHKDVISDLIIATNIDNKVFTTARDIKLSKYNNDVVKLLYLYALRYLWIDTTNMGHEISDEMYKTCRANLDELIKKNELPETVMELYKYRYMLLYGAVMNKEGDITPDLNALSELKKTLLKQ